MKTVLDKTMHETSSSLSVKFFLLSNICKRVLECERDFYIRDIYEILEPPPLPATQPPIGGYNIQQTRISTTTSSTYFTGPNVNNTSEGMMRTTTSWHSQTHNDGLNNNGENVLTNQTLNNNFLDNERAASAIAAG